MSYGDAIHQLLSNFLASLASLLSLAGLSSSAGSSGPSNPFVPLALVGLLFVLIGSFIAWNQPRALNRSAQQEDFVPGCNESGERFYALVHTRLKAHLAQSQLPFSKLGAGSCRLFSKRHIFCPRSLYVKVRYQHLSYFIYAIPAPGGLYLSTWLFSTHERWAQHSILRWLVAWRESQMTLFEFDIMCLFHQVMEGVMLEVINELREEQGLRPLEEYERRPVLNGFYAAMRQGTGAPAQLNAGGSVLPLAARQPLAARSGAATQGDGTQENLEYGDLGHGGHGAITSIHPAATRGAENGGPAVPTQPLATGTLRNVLNGADHARSGTPAAESLANDPLSASLEPDHSALLGPGLVAGPLPEPPLQLKTAPLPSGQPGQAPAERALAETGPASRPPTPAGSRQADTGNEA